MDDFVGNVPVFLELTNNAWIFFHSVLQTTGQRIQISTVSPSFVTAATSTTTTTPSGSAAMGVPIQQPGNSYPFSLQVTVNIMAIYFPSWVDIMNIIYFRFVFSEPTTVLFAYYELSSQWADASLSANPLPSGWNDWSSATHAYHALGYDSSTILTATTAWSAVEKFEKLRRYFEWDQERGEWRCLNWAVTISFNHF